MDDLKAALRLDTDANLMRAALAHYAAFVLDDVDSALFRLRYRGDRRGTGRPQPVVAS